MAASSRITAFSTILQPDQRRKTLHPCLQVRAQGFGDEDRSNRHNIDDANLQLLRDRMEVIGIKESLERCFMVHDDHSPQASAGWNHSYAPAIANKYKHQAQAKHYNFLGLLVIVCGTFGLPVLSGTLCLCLCLASCFLFPSFEPLIRMPSHF